MSKPDQERELKDGFYYTGDKGPKFGVRHVQILITAFTYAQGYSTKSVFSVAVVAMTDSTTSSNSNVPTYQWDNANILISAILWSGIPFNLPAGYLGKRFGPKWIIFGSTVINSTVFALVPLAAAYTGSLGVMVCRIVQGMCLGCLFPQNAVVMGRWAPPEVRSRAGYLVAGIVTLVVTVSSIASGQIADSHLGWPWIFYIHAGAGFFLAVVVFIFLRQSVEKHPYVSPEERKYLQTVLFENVKENKTPWVKILTNVHLWAIIFGLSGSNFFVVLLTTENAVYMIKVLKFNLATNGFISVLPTFAGIGAGIVLSTFSDYIPKKGLLSVVNCRRVFHLGGMIGLSVTIVCVTFIPIAFRWWIVALVCFSEVFLMATSLGGASPNILDISPKYAGIISGTTQTVAEILGLFGPLLVQWICTDLSDPNQWRVVYLIAGAISIGTGMVFVAFATDQRQNWDDESDVEAKSEIKKKKSSVVSLSAGLGL